MFTYLKFILKKMSNAISEFLKGEKSFYKYTKQTILILLYRIFIGCMVFTFSLLGLYIFAPDNKSELLIHFLCPLGIITLIVLLVIIWVHLYYIHIKKDIAPLQSEQHQIMKEFLTKVQGDSTTGLTIINGLKALSDENGENQNNAEK